MLPSVLPDASLGRFLETIEILLLKFPEQVEYERKGTANLFIVSEPLAGWRHINVTERRTKIDWAHQVKDLADVHYPAPSG